MECTTGLDSWLSSTSFEPPHGWIQSTSAQHERLVDELNGSNFWPASSPVTVGKIIITILLAWWLMVYSK